MDVLSPTHPARRVVLMKGAQVGDTECECGNNWIGDVIHRAPGPMLAVQPNFAHRFSTIDAATGVIFIVLLTYLAIL